MGIQSGTAKRRVGCGDEIANFASKDNSPGRHAAEGIDTIGSFVPVVAEEEEFRWQPQGHGAVIRGGPLRSPESTAIWTPGGSGSETP